MDSKVLDNITEQCNFLLKNFPIAQACKEYLDSRLDANTQDFFKFGYFPDYANISALNSLIGNDTLVDNKLCYHKNMDDSMGSRSIQFSFFENYPLIMPFKDVYGEIIALVGRTLASEKQREVLKIPKYKNTIFTKGNHLFGLFENKKQILKQDFVYIVEGQFDVIKAHEKNMRNVVALGSSNMSGKQFALLCRYTNNIFLLLDNDEAGTKGRERIIKKFGNKANIRNFYLPDQYKDIDEFFVSNTLEDLRLSTSI